MTAAEIYERAKYFFPPPPLPTAGRSECKHIPRSPGVYFVWDCNAVVYVGESVDLQKRLGGSHEHFHGARLVSFIECDKSQRRRLEAFYIGLIDPLLNKESTARCQVSFAARRKHQRDQLSCRRLLRCIEKHPACSLTQLHRMCGWRNRADRLHALIERMVEWGFVEEQRQETHGRHRRVFYLKATSEAVA